MKIKTLNISGNKNETTEISDKILKSKFNNKLIKQVIDWQINHAKTRTAKTKQRNQIKGSTKKIEHYWFSGSEWEEHLKRYSNE